MERQPISDFLDALASEAPTPGGGSAAAIIAAMGAALASMVCNLTIGKEKYAAVEADVRAALAHSEDLRGRFTRMLPEDVRAFDAVMSAYALPRGTDAEKTERAAAIQTALRRATEAPLECARACAELIALTRTVAESGNKNVISDAGVAVLAAEAALRSAALNVYINIGAIKDAAFVSSRRAELEHLLVESRSLTEAVFQRVKERM
jgi:formiminotetrahydrofolate cyclodeaminase